MNKHLKGLVATGSAVGAYLASAVVIAVQAQNTAPIEAPAGYATDIGKLISFVLRVVLAIGALLVFGYLVLGGIEYITSGGEKGKTESARNKITAAIVGLIILAASWAILNLALSFLGLNNLTDTINSVGNINK